jgi:hypothetical protein
MATVTMRQDWLAACHPAPHGKAQWLVREEFAADSCATQPRDRQRRDVDAPKYCGAASIAQMIAAQITVACAMTIER